jgi:hypothetical protein
MRRFEEDRGVSIDDLRRLLILDEATGKLYWRARSAEWFRGYRDSKFSAKACNNRNAGKETGTGLSSDGYLQVRVLSKTYFAHRVVLAMATGKWPAEVVDHTNGEKTDNRPCNLREASVGQNRVNAKANGSTASGLKGVGWVRSRGKWRARAQSNGVRAFLGEFDDKFDAARAYDAFAAKEYGEFAKLNFPHAVGQP